MSYDIEFINEVEATVDYSEQAVAEYEQGMGDRIEYYTERFESEYSVSEGEDIGGLIVYAEGRAVYDYENFCGWVR
jgi:Mg2+/Co2+ transporter CorC